jgi:SAM-dependent methyltransferase
MQKTNFQEKYIAEREPWDYSHRAVETLRHEYIADLVRDLKPSARRVLDVGCSLGQLTTRLRGSAAEIHACDLSWTAVQKTSSVCERLASNPGESAPNSGHFFFSVASSLAMPYACDTMDVILLCDGLIGWELPEQGRREVLRNVFEILAPGGVVVLTDYMHPRRFESYIGEIARSPLPIESVRYLNDRLPYQFEGWLYAFWETRFVQKLIGNKLLIRRLKSISSLFGKRGSKHLCIVGRKPNS